MTLAVSFGAQDEPLLTRIPTAILAALMLTGVVALLLRAVIGRDTRWVRRLVRDGVPRCARVVERGYVTGKLFFLRIAWEEGEREVSAVIELPATADVVEEDAYVSVLAIPRVKYVAVLVNPDLLWIGIVRRPPRRLVRKGILRAGGDSASPAAPAMPTARVVTPRKPHDP
ncbi:MAG: hypothetical protein ACM31C_34375 [Acidobacteriota bacterium]